MSSFPHNTANITARRITIPHKIHIIARMASPAGGLELPENTVNDEESAPVAPRMNCGLVTDGVELNLEEMNGDGDHGSVVPTVEDDRARSLLLAEEESASMASRMDCGLMTDGIVLNLEEINGGHGSVVLRRPFTKRLVLNLEKVLTVEVLSLTAIWSSSYSPYSASAYIPGHHLSSC